MSYVKHNWVDGETITAELLNHMEDGIASGGSGSGNLVVSCYPVDSGESGGGGRADSTTTYALNVTYDDMVATLRSGGQLVVIMEYESDGVHSVSQYVLGSTSAQELPFYYEGDGGISPKEGDGGLSRKGGETKSSVKGETKSSGVSDEGYYLPGFPILMAYRMSEDSGESDPGEPVSGGIKGDTKSDSGDYFFYSSTSDGQMTCEVLE